MSLVCEDCHQPLVEATSQSEKNPGRAFRKCLSAQCKANGTDWKGWISANAPNAPVNPRFVRPIARATAGAQFRQPKPRALPQDNVWENFPDSNAAPPPVPQPPAPADSPAGDEKVLLGAIYAMIKRQYSGELAAQDRRIQALEKIFGADNEQQQEEEIAASVLANRFKRPNRN